MKNKFKEMVAMGILATAGTESMLASDDLFSEIRGTSVFASTSTDNGASLSTGFRITSLEEVARLLREAGLEATVNERDSVSTVKKIDSWEFPVLVMISENEKEISVVLGLSSIPDSSKVPADKLLGLLEANQKYSSAHFVFNRVRQRTEVVGMLKNEAVTGLMLRDEISRLAVLARDTEDLWDLNPVVKLNPAAAAENNSSVTSTSVAPSVPGTTLQVQASSLRGTWSAVKSSSEAFAVEFRDDGKFVLVYVNQGKQTRSSGAFVLTSETLTLSGEKGFTLSGAIKSVSDSEFQFRPASRAGNSDALTFKRSK